MDAERWKRVRSLFEQLADQPATCWEDALARACPDDASIRAEALALLRADATQQDAATFAGLSRSAPQLASHLAEHLEREQAEALAGSRVGPFRLLREIGRGGMGAVWLAERADGAFAQQVAIKRMRSGSGGIAAAARFEAERQILASLQHPNIAHLVDGGLAGDGLPWLALEYVDGVDLVAWADQQRLDLRGRMRLFLSVCDAVAHAHQRLVVHRDLKPSNILVGRDGVVKLLDFGIAKLLDESGGSAGDTATRTFTPDYAAPEQVRGEAVTTAVDVHALGLLLYELLAGRRAYPGDGTGVNLAVLERDPPRPSQAAADGAAAAAHARATTPARLRRDLTGDLDAIVLKALRKEPAQRYRSAGELREDLDRWLQRRPVHARKGHWRYRAARFLRRNAIASVAALAAVAALCGGSALALWKAHEARLQRDTAEQALAFMTDLFRNADPGERARADLGARALLDEGARRIRHSLADRDAARGTLLQAIASAYLGIALPDQAEPLIDEIETLAARSDDARLRAEADLLRCKLLIERERAGDCVPLLDRIERELDAGDPEQARLIARARYQRARDLLHRNRHGDIVAQARSALALLGRQPRDRELRAELTDTLAFSLVKIDRADEAVSTLRPLVGELEAAGDAPRALAEARDTLAGALFALGRNDEALELREVSIAGLQALYGAEHPVLADNFINLGIAYYRVGRLDEARRHLQRAADICRRTADGRASALLPALGALGTVEFIAGEDAAARVHLDEAIALGERLARPVDAGRSLRWRGILSFAEGRFDAAEEDFRRSLELLAPLHGPHDVPILHAQLLDAAVGLARADTGKAGACETIASIAPRLVEAVGQDDAEARFARALGSACETPAAVDSHPQGLKADDYRLRLWRHIAAMHASPLGGAVQRTSTSDSAGQ